MTYHDVCAAGSYTHYGPVHSQQRQQSSTTTAQEKERNEQNWTRHLNAGPGKWVQSLPYQYEFQQAQQSHMQQAYHARCASAECSQCGSSATGTDISGSQGVLKLLSQKELLVVSHTRMLSIKVPIFSCTRCGYHLYGCLEAAGAVVSGHVTSTKGKDVNKCSFCIPCSCKLAPL